MQMLQHEATRSSAKLSRIVYLRIASPEHSKQAVDAAEAWCPTRWPSATSARLPAGIAFRPQGGGQFNRKGSITVSAQLVGPRGQGGRREDPAMHKGASSRSAAAQRAALARSWLRCFCPISQSVLNAAQLRARWQ